MIVCFGHDANIQSHLFELRRVRVETHYHSKPRLDLYHILHRSCWGLETTTPGFVGGFWGQAGGGPDLVDMGRKTQLFMALAGGQEGILKLLLELD